MNRYAKYSEIRRHLKELLEDNDQTAYAQEIEDFTKTLKKDARTAAAQGDLTSYNQATELLHAYGAAS